MHGVGGGNLLGKLVFYLALLLMQCVAQKSGYKNVIFIVADDLGWADVGYANQDIVTPNLNNLAQNGVILNQSYVYPLCTPSRSSFMTGVYAERMGLQHWVIFPGSPIGLPTSLNTLPEVFKRFGYATHAVGKWHLGFCNMKYTPVKRGFDTFFGIFNAQNDYYTHRVGAQILVGADGLDYWNQTSEYLEPVLDKNGTYSMFSYTEHAIRTLENHDKTKPFFLYYGSQNLHTPLDAPQSYLDKHKHVKDKNRRAYLGMLSVMDESIGNLTDALKRLDLLDDTLIFFTSDNGGARYASGINYPLRSGKATVYEGGTRVRGFIYGKDLKPYVNDGMFHAVDWMPTILHAAVGQPVEINGIDGVSHWSSITQDLPSKRTSFIYNIDPYGAFGCGFRPTEAIRNGDWKLIRGCTGQSSVPGASGFDGLLQSPDFIKLFNGSLFGNQDRVLKNPEIFLRRNVQLYNIKEDPLETRNLARRRPRIVQRLTKKLKEFKKITIEPLNAPNVPPSVNSNPTKWGDKWSPGWC